MDQGIGSNFALYNTKLRDRSHIGKTTFNNVVKGLFNYLTQDVHRKHSFTKEAGFHERITIDGYGIRQSKI